MAARAKRWMALSPKKDIQTSANAEVEYGKAVLSEARGVKSATSNQKMLNFHVIYLQVFS